MSALSLSEARDSYRQYRKSQGISASSLRSEDRAVRYLLEACGNILVRNLSARHVDMMWAQHAENWGPATHNRVRSQLSSFFKWARARGYMARDSDPLEGMSQRKTPLTEKLFIPSSRFSELLDAAEETHPRDRIICAIGLYLFLRSGETRTLQWRHVDFENKAVSVHRHKTGEFDVMPMCEELEHELKRWRLKCAELTGQPVELDWYICPPLSKPGFKRDQDGRWVMTTPSRLLPHKCMTVPHRPVKNALEKLGYESKGEGGHTLRRSGAAAWFRELGHKEDKAARIVQSALGHKDFQTTQIYLRLDHEKRERDAILRGRRMFEPESEGQVIELGEARGKSL